MRSISAGSVVERNSSRWRSTRLSISKHDWHILFVCSQHCAFLKAHRSESPIAGQIEKGLPVFLCRGLAGPTQTFLCELLVLADCGHGAFPALEHCQSLF
jgi:hypothetical protein